MKITNFECEENLKQYTDSMLFDSNETIAVLDCEVEEHKIHIELMTRGEVRVDYKGVRYKVPSEFPDELKEKIKADPHWTAGDEDLYVDMNNWFEYIYDDTVDGETYSDGIMCEIDFTGFSKEDMKKKLIEIAQLILE